MHWCLWRSPLDMAKPLQPMLDKLFFNSPVHLRPWKQILLRKFQRLHRAADVIMLVHKCFLLAIQRVATNSKFQSPLRSSISAIQSHNLLATQQLKNRWFIDSNSLQKTQVLSETSLLLAKLSLVKTLFFANNPDVPQHQGGQWFFC